VCSRHVSRAAVNLTHTTGDQGCLDFMRAKPSSGSESHVRKMTVQKLSFSPNWRLRGLKVPPAFPNSGLFKRLLPLDPTFTTPS
jgi:hypothetical protein